MSLGKNLCQTEPEFWGASFKPVSRRIMIKMVMVKTIIVTEEEN